MAMTLQAIFDKVATHLLTQNAKSKLSNNPTASCAYEGFDGTKCSIGCLFIPDICIPALERKSVHHTAVHAALFASGVVGESYTAGGIDEKRRNLLRRLQTTHDERFICEWKRALGYVAKQFQLNDDVLRDFPDGD
jgi:hypothetical protein